MPSDAEILWRALKRLPPRTEQLLFHRFVEGATDAECAAWYGIRPEAWAVQLHRAARLFVVALSDPQGPPLLPKAERIDPDVEQSNATALVTALAAISPSGPAGGAPVAPPAGIGARGTTPHGEPLPPTQTASPATSASRTPAPPPSPSAIAPLTSALARLRTHADEVRTLTIERARQELESPEFRRNEWLRRIALLLLVAAALWLWMRSPHH